MTSSIRNTPSKTIRLVGISLAASGLVLGATAGVAAANAGFSQAVYEATGLGIGPHYTQEQYDAFWDAGFTAEDQVALDELWGTEFSETKARAGQMILDDEELPFEPGTHAAPDVPESVTTFFAEGYTYGDAEELADLWDLGSAYDAKVSAGEKLVAGEELPIEPSGQTQG
ncbi:hypothetical protein GCM10028784_29470 [Myceligenerans cantabricum]